MSQKVNAGEMSEIKRLLPERVTVAVPGCMYQAPDEDGRAELDYEVVIILAWIMARREDHDITMEEVGERIGARDNEQIRQITEEILYFYTTNTREEVLELMVLLGLVEGESEDADAVVETGEEGEEVNPP